MGEKSYESFFDNSYSSLSSDYGNFIGYRIPAGQLGSTTSPNNANHVKEVVSRIREGVKNVEILGINPEMMERVPKEQFEEIRMISKLTGVKPSMHAPVVNPAGFGERGYEGEFKRQDTENMFFDVIEKSHAMDPKNIVPVVFHSSEAVGSDEFRPREGSKPGDKNRFKKQKMSIINQETGEVAMVKEDRMYSLNTNTKDFQKGEKDIKEGGTLLDIESSLNRSNVSDWDKQITNVAFYKKEADETLEGLKSYAGSLGITGNAEKLKELAKEDPQQIAHMENLLNRGGLFMQNVDLSFNSVFDKAYKYGSSKQRNRLRKMAKEWRNTERKEIKKFANNPIAAQYAHSQFVDKHIGELHSITQGINPDTHKAEKGWSSPKVFVSVNKFMMDKTAKTFSNLALRSFKKYGENAPLIAIENPPTRIALSRGEDLKNLVVKTRKQFIEKARKTGCSESKAKKFANRHIGATWDVGHINTLKGKGFTSEDVVEETKIIAPYVKHIHLTDNFGHSDSHLAPGQGNVPIKKILEELEKKGDIGKMRKIIEAGTMVDPNMGFGKSPHAIAIKAFGSPIYGAKMTPYWNQAAGVQGSYFQFPMAYLPEKHFSIYGSGFSSLPEDLGGQMPGTSSRFSGTPNA